MSTMLFQLVAWVLNLPPLLYVVAALSVVWYLAVRSREPDNLPPCPVRPYPVLGHLPWLKSDPTKIFHQWRQETGDIFTLYLGQQRAVVLNNYASMKEAFIKKGDVFSDRPPNIISRSTLKQGMDLGILSNSGASWKEQRTVSMSILRNFGMGKNFLSERISEEVEIFLQTMAELKGSPTDVRLVTNATVSNVICAILLGQRFELDDKIFVNLLRLLNENVTILSGTTLLNIFPWIQYLPGDFFKYKRVIANTTNVNNHFSTRYVKEVKKNNTGGNADENFISAFLEEMKTRKDSGKDTFLSESSLTRVISNLFVAGSETTSTTILWALIFALHHPEAQDKFYQEMVEVVGVSRRPSMLDKPKLPYVNAYIMETQRLGSIVPLSLSHLCTETTEVAGYTIPKGTTIIPNLDAVLKDSDTWGDPLVFRPERFLDETNKVVVPEEFVPFSLGRRYCMGESLAKMELFLFLTGIFQRFHVKPEDAQALPPLERIFGITCAPKAFKIRLIERE